jgi:hypothetical protein
MLIRMTDFGPQIGALLAAGAVAVGGLLGAGSDRPAPRTALVVDAALARDGRALVDARLGALDADVRLPRTQAEARTDVRYFAARGYDRVVVAGPRSTAAAAQTGAQARTASDLAGALAAFRR